MVDDMEALFLMAEGTKRVAALVRANNSYASTG